jgi:hypothetical protein
MGYLFGLNDKIRTKDHPLARLDPVHRCTTVTAIQGFKGCHPETLLITVVVRVLSEQQTFVPFVWIVQYTSSEHIVKNLIHPLYLTIGLGMISQAMDQTHPQGNMQLLSEASDKLGPSVRNDGIRHTMQAQDARNIQFSHVEGVHRNEMSRLSKPIDDYQNGVKLAVGERQTHNEIHTDVFPFPGRNTQGLQQSHMPHMISPIKGLCDVRLCQHRRCSQQLLQGLERFITLCIPDKFLLFLQKISDWFRNLGEVQNKSTIVASQAEKAVNLVHNPWWLSIQYLSNLIQIHKYSF